MEASVAPSESHSFAMKPWEFNAFAIESILAGAGLFVLVFFGGPRIVSRVPMFLWGGAGFFVLGLAGLPFQAVYARSLGHELSIGRRLGWTVLAAVLFAAIWAAWPGAH